MCKRKNQMRILVYNMTIIIDIYYDRFIEKNDEGHGWIVKTPFTTNGHNKRYANSVEGIIKRITMQYKTLKEVLPYTMVQATMVNKKEYKIVLFKGEARYISRAPGYTNGTAFSTKPELMDFAINALKEFAFSSPGAFCLPLRSIGFWSFLSSFLRFYLMGFCIGSY